jgi:hypothetical protein
MGLIGFPNGFPVGFRWDFEKVRPGSFGRDGGTSPDSAEISASLVSEPPRSESKPVSFPLVPIRWNPKGT